MLAECDCVRRHCRHRRADGCSAMAQIWRRCRRMPLVVVDYAHAQPRSEAIKRQRKRDIELDFPDLCVPKGNRLVNRAQVCRRQPLKQAE